MSEGYYLGDDEICERNLERLQKHNTTLGMDPSEFSVLVGKLMMLGVVCSLEVARGIV